MINTDSQDLASARATWNARKSESSLIGWTLSPEWTGGDWGNAEIRGTVRDDKLNHGPLKNRS